MGGRDDRPGTLFVAFAQALEHMQRGGGVRADGLAEARVAGSDRRTDLQSRASGVRFGDHEGAERDLTNQHVGEIREERFELMARLAELPPDLTFFTQITMESAEDPEFLEAMRAAISPATVAIMIEGIQGEGGVTPASPEYLLGLRQLCDEKRLLLFMDAVQCGHFRSGRFQALQSR